LEIIEEDKKLAEYKIYEQKEKIKKEEKKKQYMQMMLNNLETQNQKLMKDSHEEFSKSHLVNTKDIIMMDQH
jgi:hypothetical protein